MKPEDKLHKKLQLIITRFSCFIRSFEAFGASHHMKENWMMWRILKPQTMRWSLCAIVKLKLNRIFICLMKKLKMMNEARIPTRKRIWVRKFRLTLFSRLFRSTLEIQLTACSLTYYSMNFNINPSTFSIADTAPL